MPRFAANLSLLFAELPYLDRFAAAAEAGFEAVEILFPYDVAAKETQRALLANGLELVLINAPPPNYTGGVPGYAALPEGEARFQHDIRRVMRYADVLKPGLIHVMAGKAGGAQAYDTFVRNLQWAADLAPQQGFTIEPLNHKDQPGYFLADYALAARVLDDVDRPNVGLQYDAYHAHMIHGDAAAVWQTYGSRAVHVQFGAPPDRTAPSPKNPIDFKSLIDSIDSIGYAGWVSAEYVTQGDTRATLGWMPPPQGRS